LLYVGGKNLPNWRKLMEQHREVDTGLLQMIKGSDIRSGLEEMSVQLIILQTACIMCLDGIARATAGDIASRAIRDYNIEVTASITGQVLSRLGITTVTSHGKSRYVLEYDRLENIRKDMSEKCEEQSTKLKEVMKEFRYLPKRIKELEARWQEILNFRRREQALINAINENQAEVLKVKGLEARVASLEQRLEQVKGLEKECKILTRRVNKLPDLEERKKSLETSIRKHGSEVSKIEQREAELRSWIDRLQKRVAWANLADLERAIDKGRQELEQLSEQLGEKRSLLDRILRRKTGETDE